MGSKSPSFTIDTNFFNTKVLLFIFSIIKSPFDSACNVTSDIILAWWGYITLASCITPLKQDVAETQNKKFPQSPIILIPIIPFVLTKKMHTHTWCFYSQTKKLQAFEILKWDSGVTEKAEVIQKLIFFTSEIQGSPFITLCLGSIEMDRVISEPCYKGITS